MKDDNWMRLARPIYRARWVIGTLLAVVIAVVGFNVYRQANKDTYVPAPRSAFDLTVFKAPPGSTLVRDRYQVGEQWTDIDFQKQSNGGTLIGRSYRLPQPMNIDKFWAWVYKKYPPPGWKLINRADGSTPDGTTASGGSTICRRTGYRGYSEHFLEIGPEQSYADREAETVTQFSIVYNIW
jgi:hypothetical protein